MDEDIGTGGTSPHPLSRELIARGGLADIVARGAPGTRLMTDTERAASIASTLAANPSPGDGVWLFAYGSLIWNPTIRVAARRRVRIDGWRRAFCLKARAGRGTAAAPGLVLGLLAGGMCDGIALRVADDGLEDELDLLWRREMLANSYVPRWLPMTVDDGATPFGHAIAFTLDPTSHAYAGDLPNAEVVRLLATACGELGSCADYLFRTDEALHSHGIVDPAIDRLVEEVRAVLASG